MIVGVYSTRDDTEIGRYIATDGDVRAEAVVTDPAVKAWASAGLMQSLDELAAHHGLTRRAALDMLARGWSDGQTRTRLIEA